MGPLQSSLRHRCDARSTIGSGTSTVLRVGKSGGSVKSYRQLSHETTLSAVSRERSSQFGGACSRVRDLSNRTNRLSQMSRAECARRRGADDVSHRPR